MVNKDRQPSAAKRVTCSVRSEYGRLRAVLVNRPSGEIDRLAPGNKARLLFEDIPYLTRMQAEHDQFVELLRGEGVEVLYFRELLQDLLNMEKYRRQLVLTACDNALQSGLGSVLLDYYSESELCSILIEGLTARELEKRTDFEVAPRIVIDRRGHRIQPPSEEFQDPFLIAPLPNLYFMRDPGLIFQDGFISTKMHFEARVRESILMRAVVEHHPGFAGTPVWYGNTVAEDRPFTIEGGDVIVISGRSVAIGASQRTRPETIRHVALRLFRQHLVDRVYAVPIPSARAYMHLDTVFTIIGHGVIITYPRVMDDIVGVKRYEPIYAQNDEVFAAAIDEPRSFIDVLSDEFGRRVEIVQTGRGNERDAAREQASDGTNVLAIDSGVAVTYDRNRRTNEALADVGVRVLTFDGSELVRGLGGPRCMTMPLWREP